MPKKSIRSTFVKTCGSFFTPAYYRLFADSQLNPKPYIELQKARKSKGIALISGVGLAGDGGEMEFERELAWLEERLGEYCFSPESKRDRLTTFIAKEKAEKEEADRKRKIHDEAIANGDGLECGCCFGDEILVRLKVSRTA